MAKNQIFFNFLGISDKANFSKLQMGPNDKCVRKCFQNKDVKIVDGELAWPTTSKNITLFQEMLIQVKM